MSTSLTAWLRQSALPLWAEAGVDRGAGGFFEKLDARAGPVHEPRRTRVVARQIYVFATAGQRGWLDGAGADRIVDHGLAFLLDRMKLADGMFAASVRVDGTVVDGRFDLYEHAFVLFALAAAAARWPHRTALLRAEAEALLDALRRRHGHPDGGFREGVDGPLRSNPHMHLLEAALAWQERSGDADSAVWDALVVELVDLCLARFLRAGSGALTEYFDDDWHCLPDARGRVVEPGHQFEWAWLLLRVARRDGRADAEAAAWRLLEIGEAHGVDRRRNVACDALDTDFAVVDAHAKLWPQTERIKAWRLAVDASRSVDERTQATRGFERAVRGLQPYLRTWPTGLWHEQMRADGNFVPQSVRASSLYHIVCAVDAVAPGHGRAGGLQ